MINFTKELPQTQQWFNQNMLSNTQKFQWQRQLEAVFDILGAKCICDAVFLPLKQNKTRATFIRWLSKDELYFCHHYYLGS